MARAQRSRLDLLVAFVDVEAREIEFLRRVFDLRPSELAHALCLAPITVERWERGDNKPTGLALAVLRALYQAAEEIDRCADTARARSIRALLLLGIGTLLSTLLREHSQRPRQDLNLRATD